MTRHLHMRFLILLICSGLFGSQTSLAQKRQLVLNPEKLTAIDELLTQAVDDEKLVGCSALVFHNGKEKYFKAFGKRDAKKDLPVQRDTIFRIYSMSKPITSVAAMQLVEQGKMKLDDPVSKYLKPFADLRVAKIVDEKIEEIAPKREMTVRDLLRHTSGLSYGFFDNTQVDKLYVKKGILLTDRNLEEMVKKLGTVPLKHHPGSRFEYSASTDVLGRLVEVVSGQRFDQFLRKNIFDPLEMKDTSFVVPKQKQSRLAEMYRPRGGKLIPSPAFSSARFLNPDNEFFSGGGGLCSTIDDYLNFSQMLTNGGEFNGRRVLKAETLKQMFTNQLDSIDQPSSGFRFGLGFRISPGKLGSDYSWGGIAGTRFWVNPEQKLIVLFMTQINPYGRRNFGRRIRGIGYQALLNE